MALGMENVKRMRSVTNYHLMMLLSLGHGHLIRFMHLAKKLIPWGFTVTFVVNFIIIFLCRRRWRMCGGLDWTFALKVPIDDLALGKVNRNSMKWHEILPLNFHQRPLARLLRTLLGVIYEKNKAIPSQLFLDDSLWISSLARHFLWQKNLRSLSLPRHVEHVFIVTVANFFATTSEEVPTLYQLFVGHYQQGATTCRRP